MSQNSTVALDIPTNTMDGLSESQLDALAQFRTITGVEDRESDVLLLLTVNNYDLNSSVSNFFDSGFDSVARAAESTEDSTPIQDISTQNENSISSGSHFHDASGLQRREPELINLQSQFLESRMLPRLPKAPKIGTSWTFEVGIHSLLKESYKKEEIITKVRPINYLWIILLFIPKNLLHFILAAIRYLSSSRVETNRFPLKFDFEKFDLEYDVLKRISHPGKAEEEVGVIVEEKVDVNEEGAISVDPKPAEEKVVEKESAQANELDYNISTSDYNSLHETSQRKYFWLLVILINDSPESLQFVNNLLSTTLFKKLFNNTTGEYKETLIYLNNVDTNREAYEIGYIHKVRRTPYVMLIGNVTNNPAVMHSMSILYKSNLPYELVASPGLSQITSKRVSKNLHKLLDNFNPQLVSLRYDQQEIEFARLIKQQQDSAYEQSLERDRLKKLQKELHKKLQQEAQESVRIRREKLDQLHNLDYKQEVTTTDKAEGVRVAIKLPSGKRIIETFSKTILANELYLYVELLLDEMTEDTSRSEVSLSEISSSDVSVSDLSKIDDSSDTLSEMNVISNEEYFQKYPFNFEVFQPMPKKVVEPGNLQIATVTELRSGANLLVEYLG